jgi:adenylate cyclase
MILRDKDRLLFAEEELVFCNPLGAGVEPGAPGYSTRNTPTAALNAQSLTTIVVVDIRDFTPLARKLSEALLSQTIGTWFLRVGQVAEQRGSWAQQYIGDAMMAVWVHDNPTTIPSDLGRALRAVCEIERTTEEISRTLSLPAPLRIGAGISTGPAILGGTDYTALGDTVNAAFRLEAATKTIGLSVALGERAFQALEVPDATYPFQRRRVQLKGYEDSSTAWAISFEELRGFLATRGQ